MSRIAGLLVANADILVLQPDQAPPGRAASDPAADIDFGSAPFAIGRFAPTASCRLVEEATEWGHCRARRLRLEEQLALKEEFRTVGPDEADDIRSALSQIERRIGDEPIDEVLRRLTAVQRRLYEDADELDWT
jgi:hypothetical protein